LPETLSRFSEIRRVGPSGNHQVSIMRSGLGLILCVFGLLAGCGGGDKSAPAVPPPPASNPDPVIGANGGTVTEVSGASVVFPAGAIAANTTIRIARDSTGAPALPADLTSAGSVYVITPHGGDFLQPVLVHIPAPNVTLQPNQQIKLAKAEPGGDWVVLEDTEFSGGTLSVNVTSFSYFMPVIVSYLIPIAQAQPLSVADYLDCGPLQACARAHGTINGTFTVTTNGGQVPATCANPQLAIVDGRGLSYGGAGFAPTLIPLSGGSLIRTIEQTQSRFYKFGVGLRCSGAWHSYGNLYEKVISWAQPQVYPGLSIERVQLALDVVEGARADVDVILSGGSSQNPDEFLRLQDGDYSIIDWQRSDDGGTSWRNIARSFENEANSLPYGSGIPWTFWSVRHGFVATATDQGALIRVHACYTPLGATTTNCVTGTATQLNVLQQSTLPTIVTPPRSVLIRSGQTANLSVTAAGLPAPTLRWQSRAANSSGAWTDVITGTGPLTANYTTSALALSDNGTQYRVVASNALGSADSSVATVSVSDLDVAPSIATQPASLNVASGSDAVFAVDARGTEALSYQWFRNGVALSGENSSVLRLTGVSVLNSGSFSVTVSNDAGDADSNAATLNVYPAAPVAVAPTIVTQPAAVTVNAGNTATFAVGVDGSGPFTFAWRKDGVAIPGATSAVLTLNAVATSGAGDYSVVVSNAASPGGVTSATAALTVTANAAANAPTITTQPSTLILTPGGSGILAVGASGSGPLTYQWFHGITPIPGATSAVLTITNVGASDAGSYQVSVTNSLAGISSQRADVILLGAPVITSQPASLRVFENFTATFHLEATGSGMHYQWLRNGAEIANSDADTYTTTPLTAADSGAVYTAIVFNASGAAVSTPAVLTVSVAIPPTVLQEPADSTIVANNVAQLCMAFGGTPPFSVQMNRWDGTQWTQIGSRLTVNDNAPFCTISPPLQLADSGAQFRFYASNADSGPFEAITRTATITVTAPSVVTTTTLVSRATGGATADNVSTFPSLSTDGQTVAFVSEGTNLAPGFSNPGHAYVRNLQTGVTTAIDQTPAGTEPNARVIEMKMAAGGRYVVFTSLASDLVPNDTNGSQDVFLRDLQTGTTQRLNVLADGSELPGYGNGVSDARLDISADGRYVLFASFFDLSNAGAAMSSYSLFLRDTQTNQTRVVLGNSPYGVQYCALSSGGGFVVMQMPGVATSSLAIYDVTTLLTSTLFTMDTSSGSDYLAQGVSISGDGRYVAFAARSTPLFGTAATQVAVIDRNDPTTLITASTGSAGSGIGVGNGTSTYPRLSYDGRYVAFATTAANLSGNVAGLNSVLMVRDLQTQTTSLASRRANGTPVQTAVGVYNSHAISADGSVVAFAGDESVMTGGIPDHQLYAAPRP
jgi:hypothetical protein